MSSSPQFFSSLFRILVFCLLMLGTIAEAQAPRATLGTLTCTLGDEGDGKNASEGRALRCVFKPTDEGAEQAYSGIIRQVAQGQVPSGKLVMVWVVQGPANAKVGPAQLQQTFVGARAASGSTDEGGTLIGERNTEFTLHPESADRGPAGALVTVLQLTILTERA